MEYILGIETSCDETAASVIDSDGNILSNVVLSQIDIHKEFGGVIPEVASRNHVKVIDVVVKQALVRQVAKVAATSHPGLPGAVMVGRVFGEALAFALGAEFIEVNHILGHIASVPLCHPEIRGGAHIALVVSGGHTALYQVKGTEVELLETTSDDAIGEAFDKVARVLGLPYPGGPQIAKMAATHPDTPEGCYINFVSKPNYHREGFSYSGLKTAVINYLNRLKQRGEEIDIPQIAASFQREAVAQIVYKCLRALNKTKDTILCVSGGVSANRYLREELARECGKIGVAVYFPPLELTGDNAAMIAGAALFHLKMQE